MVMLLLFTSMSDVTVGNRLHIVFNTIPTVSLRAPFCEINGKKASVCFRLKSTSRLFLFGVYH